MHVRARTLNEAFPVLKWYCNKAQSSQDPKRGISSNEVVLQDPNEAFPVLKLYYNPAQSSQDPKGGISSNKVVLQPSTIQNGPRTKHFQY